MRWLAVLGLVAGMWGPSMAFAGFNCQPGRDVPTEFVFGFADLNEAVGGAMGAPAECEYADRNGTGDTLQHTTGGSAGLAYWRKATNTPTWFDGVTHYALTQAGLVSWIGPNVDPPGIQATPAPPPAAVAVSIAPPPPPPAPVPPPALTPPQSVVVANPPYTNAVGDTLAVARGNWAWLAPGRASGVALVAAIQGLALGGSVPFLLASTARRLDHLTVGTTVRKLEDSGEYFTHVLVLDGPYAGTEGDLPNKALHS